MGKSSINGPFSMAMLNNQRVICMSAIDIDGSELAQILTPSTYPGYSQPFLVDGKGDFPAERNVCFPTMLDSI